MITITDQAERIHALRRGETVEITVGRRDYEVSRHGVGYADHDEEHEVVSLQVGPMTVEFRRQPDFYSARHAGGGQEVDRAHGCTSSEGVLETLDLEEYEHEAWLARRAARKTRSTRRAA